MVLRLSRSQQCASTKPRPSAYALRDDDQTKAINKTANAGCNNALIIFGMIAKSESIIRVAGATSFAYIVVVCAWRECIGRSKRNDSIPCDHRTNQPLLQTLHKT